MPKPEKPKPKARRSVTRASKYANYASEVSEKVFQQRVIAFARFSGFRTPRADELAPHLDLIMHIYDSRKSTGTGFPDLVLVHPKRGEVWFCELKAERGRLSEDQKLWRAVLEEIERKTERVFYRMWRPSDWPEVVRELSAGTQRDDRLFL